MRTISHVEVVTPEEYVGDVMGDLVRRGARIDTQARRGDMLVVGATVSDRDRQQWRTITTGTLEPATTPERVSRTWTVTSTETT